jgi:hypothetical protein
MATSGFLTVEKFPPALLAPDLELTDVGRKWEKFPYFVGMFICVGDCGDTW